MTDLKTLKDLSRIFVLANLKDVIAVEEDVLRQEAIKHIKHYTDLAENLVHGPAAHNYGAAASLMLFFNITEEDLK